MKKFLLISNVVLFIAVIVLFILFFRSKSTCTESFPLAKRDTLNAHNLPIAYINVDSLLLKYQFAKDANESLIKKQEDFRLTINSRQRELQGEMNEFQRKLENNAFLSRERAEQEQTRLLKKQQELQNLNGQLTQELMQEQQKMSEQLRDTINAFLKEYNKDGKYQLILSNTAGDNILYAPKGYDITDEVVKLLNERCAQKKK
ncbi:MAG: OmpH family outer membrane protein [Bacteroidales bacterium]|jgi:outer membrane protein|nr:OmpH family outer membrane protein [Bacteroidales bacterium]